MNIVDNYLQDGMVHHNIYSAAVTVVLMPGLNYNPVEKWNSLEGSMQTFPKHRMIALGFG